MAHPKKLVDKVQTFYYIKSTNKDFAKEVFKRLDELHITWSGTGNPVGKSEEFHLDHSYYIILHNFLMYSDSGQFLYMRDKKVKEFTLADLYSSHFLKLIGINYE